MSVERKAPVALPVSMAMPGFEFDDQMRLTVVERHADYVSPLERFNKAFAVEVAKKRLLSALAGAYKALDDLVPAIEGAGCAGEISSALQRVRPDEIVSALQLVTVDLKHLESMCK